MTLIANKEAPAPMSMARDPAYRLVSNDPGSAPLSNIAKAIMFTSIESGAPQRAHRLQR
jgi:hypothetical protein